jgi:hypothetical protein
LGATANVVGRFGCRAASLPDKHHRANHEDGRRYGAMAGCTRLTKCHPSRNRWNSPNGMWDLELCQVVPTADTANSQSIASETGNAVRRLPLGFDPDARRAPTPSAKMLMRVRLCDARLLGLYDVTAGSLTEQGNPSAR